MNGCLLSTYSTAKIASNGTLWPIAVRAIVILQILVSFLPFQIFFGMGANASDKGTRDGQPRRVVEQRASSVGGNAFVARQEQRRTQGIVRSIFLVFSPRLPSSPPSLTTVQ